MFNTYLLDSINYKISFLIKNKVLALNIFL